MPLSTTKNKENLHLPVTLEKESHCSKRNHNIENNLSFLNQSKTKSTSLTLLVLSKHSSAAIKSTMTSNINLTLIGTINKDRTTTTTFPCDKNLKTLYVIKSRFYIELIFNLDRVNKSIQALTLILI